MNNVSIVIVNFNTSEILQQCLVKLQEIDRELDVIVIDNSSADDSAQAVRQKFPHVRLIALSENKGLSVAHNKGLEASTRKYVLYLGSDAFPKNGTIEGIAKYMDDHLDVGVATAKLVLRDGSLDMDAHRGFPTPWASFCHFSGMEKLFKGSRIFDQYFMGYEDLTKAHEIDLGISHFMFVRKSVFDAVGKWDEDYFVFGEDVDMYYRIKQGGFKIMYLPQFEATHYKGVSAGIRKETKDVTKATPETKKRMTRSTTEGMKLFYKKHYSQKYPALLSWLVLSAVSILSKIRESRVK